MKEMRTNEFRILFDRIYKGDTFYLNAINCSMLLLNYVRNEIKCGRIKPVREEVEKMISDEETIEKVMKGEMLCPQMTYIKC